MKRSFKKIIILSVAALVAVIGLVGCTARPGGTPSPAPAEGLVGSTPGPLVTIDAVMVDFPTDTTLAARNITIEVSVTNFNIVEKLSGTPAAGEGHLHYYLDVDPPTTAGEPAITDEESFRASTETSLLWENVSPGSHTLSVQLVNNDHTPLEPPVTDSIRITVASGLCGATAKPTIPPGQ
jgi:hypothetical protein